MEKKMETTGVIGVIQGSYRGYIGLEEGSANFLFGYNQKYTRPAAKKGEMKKKMQTFRV